MAKKFYAVKRGRKTGIFNSWDECKEQIDKFSNAVYKSFDTKSEALAWLGVPQEVAPLSSQIGSLKTKKEPEPIVLSGGKIIYTDGACSGNPGRGGWAAVIVDGDETRELSGGEKHTTNNRMEMTAAIRAFEAVDEGEEVDLFTDSQYLKNAFTKGWLNSWKKKGWVTATGEPVKNQDLWLELDALFAARKVNFHWVKGHDGDKYNERCDKLARSEAAKF